MENMNKPKVQITDADKQKRYFKYYERDLAPIAPQKMGTIFGPPMIPVGKLVFTERGKILEP